MFSESAQALLLRFETPLDPNFDSRVGRRTLAAFLVVAVGVFYAARPLLVSDWLPGLPVERLIFVLTFLGAFGLCQRLIVPITAEELGLKRPSRWSYREKLFLLQALPAVAIPLAILFHGHFTQLAMSYGHLVWIPVLTGLLWGAGQELVYRGWLQGELHRRFGPTTGLLVANALFTLGPLHYPYPASPDGIRFGLLVATFGIGYVLGLIYLRSGNLWLPAILHGLWPANMV